jgi:predicted acyltransferase
METSQKRLVSLDVFRGITIAGMILVNNPGDWGHIYSSLGHAEWHGVTPTDLIFPFFLFIVGVAITLSLSKRKERGDSPGKLYLQILRRSFMIFLFGMILAGFPYFNLTTIRIPGVLQRIALVYCITSFLFLKSNIKTMTIISFVILFVYWALMTLIPVPGVGYASLEPATNLGAWLDRLLLSGHLWAGATDPSGMFPKGSWDPEGLLSTLPAISTGIFGVLTGHYLMKSKDDKTTQTVKMFVVGNFALLISMFWDMWFPINKKIWTSSYVIYCGGLALIFLAMCIYLIDIKGIKWWTKPFLVYGMNAITVYFLSGIVARLLNLIKVTGADGIEVNLKTYLYNILFTSWLSPINASLAWAVFYVLFWLGLMWILYAKKIFIKV